jgi:hypothetical protein
LAAGCPNTVILPAEVLKARMDVVGKLYRLVLDALAASINALILRSLFDWHVAC